MSDAAIAEHAFLSDCHSSALVTRRGSVDWLCLPRFDSAPVLGRLLDDTAGHLLLAPDDPSAEPDRHYLPHSLVLETDWTCPSGRLLVHDALALGDDEGGHDLGRHSPGVLLRQARCVSGSVAVRIEWAPRPEFGLVHPILLAVPGGLQTRGGPTVLQLSTDAQFTISGSSATAIVVLHEGETLDLAMEQMGAWDAPVAFWSAAQTRERLQKTEWAWQHWSQLHQAYQGPLHDLVHSSGRVLKGLTFAPSGAVVAAATTSLPEGEGTGRTWDYRFTWIRDASMTMRGLWVAACPDDAARFFGFVARAAGTQLGRGRHLQIMFGVGGERDLTERELPHLTGWRGSRPVRAGNNAWDQVQQDVYGALLDAAWVLREQLDNVDQTTREFLVDAVEAAIRNWQVPDQGIWEVRGPPRRYLQSALMCWVAVDRGVRLAEKLGAQHSVARWSEVRDAIRSDVLELGWNPTVGSFTQALDGDELDASSLLMALVGILPPDDPRLAATIDAVAQGLSDRRGLLYRYRADDGLEGEEGTFLLCTFWLAEALAVTGRAVEAEVVLLRAASHANDLGLLAEQTGSDGQMLGNYPQAFSHLGLILAANALSHATDASVPMARTAENNQEHA